MTNSLFELRLICPVDKLETISDALAELGAVSVSIEDFDASTEREKPLFGEPNMPILQEGWEQSRILALFLDEILANQSIETLRDQDFFNACRVENIVKIADQDWVRLTQAQFEPVEITPTFWIVPSWSEVPESAKTFIRLDPGLAFGTGTHPTTFMCLRWIANHLPQEATLLDYGCGSGILAIAGAKFGASKAVGVDIDPCAILATNDNAASNRVTVLTTETQALTETFDMVVANILAIPLKSLSQTLTKHLKMGGELMLSGILKTQAQDIIEHYAKHLPLSIADQMEDWVLLVGQKSRGD